MKKNTMNLSDSNIYLDRYGDTVYYNLFDKNGYIVSKEMEQKFRVFYYRYSIIFIFVILLGDYFKTFQNTLLLGFGASLLVELYFRFVFLKKLKVIKNFNRERKLSKLEALVKSKAKDKIIMKACAYALLSVLLIINAMQQNFNILLLILSIIGSVYSFYTVIIDIIAFTKIKNK